MFLKTISVQKHAQSFQHWMDPSFLILFNDATLTWNTTFVLWKVEWNMEDEYEII